MNIVVNPDLSFPLGAANGGAENGLEFAVEYNPTLFMKYLQVCLKRYKKSLQAQTSVQLEELMKECMNDVFNEHRYTCNEQE